MGSACILLITICALLSSSVALLPRPAEDCPWSYNVLDVVYLGPNDWICNITGTDPWTCLDGSLQSPIDLPPSITAAEPAYTADVKRASAKFAFSKNLVVNVTYVPSVSGGLGFNDSEEVLVNNVIKGQKVPSELVFEGFYVRSPSEHTIGGKQFNLEIQFAYSDPNATAADQWYFVSFLAEATPTDSAGFASLADHLTGSPIEVAGADLSLFNIGQGFWHYSGSVTFPPCGPANWFVSSTVLGISQDTISALLTMNIAVADDIRPVQPHEQRALAFVDGTFATDKGGNWKAAVGVSAGLLGVIFIILIAGAIAFRN